MPRPDLHEDNRVAWNAATTAHNSHKLDQASFLSGGGTTLFPEELDLLGDIAGTSLLHLQCNAGQDSLSLARLGARVTGIDISDEAIAFATALSADSGTPATFVRADVYDWLSAATTRPKRFDIVFASYGCLVWLSDLTAWGEGIASVLAPGGRVVLLDFHPFAMVFECDWSHKLPYFADGKPETYEHGVGDYVGMSGDALTPSGYSEGVKDWVNPHRGHEFQWGLGEVATALTGAGLAITTLREYPYSNGAKLFDRMRETPGRRMVPPDAVPNLPLMFGMVANKL